MRKLGGIHSIQGISGVFIVKSESGDVDYSSGWFNLRGLVFPTRNANSEFAVTALSECSSAQVILTWSLQ